MKGGWSYGGVLCGRFDVVIWFEGLVGGGGYDGDGGRFEDDGGGLFFVLGLN